jgi:hypothetical protein
MYESRVGVDVLECATGKVNRSEYRNRYDYMWGVNILNIVRGWR